MAFLEGRKLGSFELLERIGKGGMAEVYRARQTRLNREVAVKILPASLALQEGFVERFEHEARAIARMEHHNVLPVYDYGEQDGVIYLVMPLVRGGSLREKLQTCGALSPLEADHYLRQMADALGYAHKQGIIHRDVKPANMLLTPDDRLLLADFGIAKVLEQNTRLTQTGTGIGTPEYMAPEQAMGQQVDSRADIYALGVVLFQMLTGSLPFTADTPIAVAYMHTSQPLPSLRQLNPRITPAMEAVVCRAMAKAPADRYASTLEMADDFHNAVLAATRGAFAEESDATRLAQPKTPPDPSAPSLPSVSTLSPLPAAPHPSLETQRAISPPDSSSVSTPPAYTAPPRYGPTTYPPGYGPPGYQGYIPIVPSPPERRREPSSVLLLVVAFIGVIGIIVALAVLVYLLRSPQQGATTPPGTQVTSVPPATTVSPATSVPATPVTVTKGPPTQAPTQAPTATPVPTPVGPVGKIVFVKQFGDITQVYSANIDGSNEHQLTSGGAHDQAVWSPDGQHIALREDANGSSQIAQIDADGSNPQVIVAASAKQPGWAPNGTLAYSGGDGQGNIVVRFGDGNTKQLTSDGASQSPSWSPDGKQIAYMSNASGSWQIHTMNADGSNNQTFNIVGNARNPRWSPAGRQLVFNSGTADVPDQVWVVNADGSGLRQLTSEGNNGRPTWSPDGRFILFNAKRGDGPSQIFIMNADGSNQHAITSGDGDHFQPDWHTS